MNHLHLMSFCTGLAAASALAQAQSGDTIFVNDFQTCPAAIALGDGSVRNLVTRAAVSYGSYPQQRLNADLTEWDGIWGHNSVNDPVTPWPGVGGASPVIQAFPRAGYFCAHFHAPADAGSRIGHFSNPTLIQGPNLTMAISRNGGDFVNNLPTAGCLAANVPSADANLVNWKFTANAPGSYCNLQVDSDYYVNVMFTDAQSTFHCGAAAVNCSLAVISYHN